MFGIVYAFCYFSSNKASDKVHTFIYRMPFFTSNAMFYHVLESFHRDDSNTWSNIGFGVEMTQLESIEVSSTHLIWTLTQDRRYIYRQLTARCCLVLTSR